MPARTSGVGDSFAFDAVDGKQTTDRQQNCIVKFLVCLLLSCAQGACSIHGEICEKASSPSFSYKTPMRWWWASEDMTPKYYAMINWIGIPFWSTQLSFSILPTVFVLSRTTLQVPKRKLTHRCAFACGSSGSRSGQTPFRNRDKDTGTASRPYALGYG